METFPSRMFRGAALYGVIVLLPLYFQPVLSQGQHMVFGFIGLALVFQWLFWIIGGDPVKYRGLMWPAIAEKLLFGVPALILWQAGKVQPLVATFALIDLLIAVGFYAAWKRTPASPGGGA